MEQLWRAVGIFRCAALVHASVLIVRDQDEYAHPGRGHLTLAVMVGRSLITILEERIIPGVGSGKPGVRPPPGESGRAGA